MIVDVRTTMTAPGRLGAWLKLHEAEGMPIHVRDLGQPIGVFTTDVGTVNHVVFFWDFESQADRERRREALEADPHWSGPWVLLRALRNRASRERGAAWRSIDANGFGVVSATALPSRSRDERNRMSGDVLAQRFKRV